MPRAEFIQNNLGLVHACAGRFRNRGIEYEELYAAGCLGLVKACDGFDASRGLCFSTYAVPMISGEIKRFLRDDGAVKVSRWAKSLAQKINVFIDEQLKNGNKEPSVDEIAEKFQVEREQVVFAMDTTHYMLSLSSTVGDDDLALEDKIAGEPSLEEDLDKIMLRDFIQDLPHREKKVIILRDFRDKTQSEIASELGVSQVQVSRIECKVLQKLKSKLEEQ